MFKDKDKQKQANKLAAQRYRANKQGIAKKPVIESINNAQDGAGSINSVIPDTIIPSNVIPRDTLPAHIMADIVHHNQRYDAGDKIKLKQRIQRAMDYQRLYPDNGKSGLSADGSTFTDATGVVHQWPAVLDTVNITGKPRVTANV